MEDHFLYRLRNGQLQSNKGSYRTKKSIEHKKDGNANFDLQKQFGKLLEKIVDLQKDTLVCLEKVVRYQDKQSETISKVADTLKIVSELNLSRQENKNKIHSGKLGLKTGKEIFVILNKMRGEGKTWNEIASYLKEEKIPTLTGKGTWTSNLVLYFHKKLLSQYANEKSTMKCVSKH